MPEWRNKIVGHGEEAPEQLMASPWNWRIHPGPQQDALLGAISDVGYIRSVTVNQVTGHVVDGHLRVVLAMRTGQATIPVEYVELTEEEEKEALLTLDPISALAGMDSAKVDELLKEVKTQEAGIQALLDEMAKQTGLLLAEIEQPEAQFDKAGELHDKWNVQAGQLWVIPSLTGNGSHRLICGDSTDPLSVDKLFNGKSAALLCTDPPYNVGKEYGEADDSMSEDDYETFTTKWLALWSKHSQMQIVTPGSCNLESWYRTGKIYHMAPWTKTNAMTNGRVSRFQCWEPIVFIGEHWKRERPNDVYNFPVPPQRVEGLGTLTGLHPCPKPIAMWLDLIQNYSNPGDTVADAFDGSGTTLVAAEQLGRIAYVSELSPQFCAVALERVSLMGLEPMLE